MPSAVAAACTRWVVDAAAHVCAARLWISAPGVLSCDYGLRFGTIAGFFCYQQFEFKVGSMLLLYIFCCCAQLMLFVQPCRSIVLWSYGVVLPWVRRDIFGGQLATALLD
ncbi:hypothetical protein COO60DRAFT_1503988 [Scenedesmus sp. NREL 46B-D3]|nr:hypothetical protein COO60DRAFT_1503988 [Scenedesmus sp. NREL 46B-D3]